MPWTPTGTYAVAYDSTITSYAVSTVTVTGIDVGCNGKTLSATLTGTGGTSLGTNPPHGAPGATLRASVQE